jgi:hypothetical protein
MKTLADNMDFEKAIVIREKLKLFWVLIYFFNSLIVKLDFLWRLTDSVLLSKKHSL